MGKRKPSITYRNYHYVLPKKKCDHELTVEHDHNYILTLTECSSATDRDSVTDKNSILCGVSTTDTVMDKNSILCGVGTTDTEGCEADKINQICVPDQECYPYVSQSEVVEDIFPCHPSEPEIVSDLVEANESCTLFYKNLKQDIAKFLNSPYIMNNIADVIQVFELYPSVSQPSVKLSLTMDTDLSAKLCVHRIEITHEHEFWTGLSRVCDSVEKIIVILDKLKNYSVCIGNPDDCFQELVDTDCTVQEHLSGALEYKEENFCAVTGDTSYTSTIRSTKCKFLVQGARCQPCSKARRNLRVKFLRLKEKRKNIENTPNYLDKKYRHCNMDRQALLDKLKQQKNKIRTLESEKVRLLRNELPKDSSSQNSGNTDLKTSWDNEICKAYPDENSLQRLFWNEQRKCASVKSRSGMRWDPEIIRWCLHMQQISSSAYDALCDSGFITLPSSRTLFDYSHEVRTVGFDKNVNKPLKNEAKKNGMFDKP